MLAQVSICSLCSAEPQFIEENILAIAIAFLFDSYSKTVTTNSLLIRDLEWEICKSSNKRRAEIRAEIPLTPVGGDPVKVVRHLSVNI